MTVMALEVMNFAYNALQNKRLPVRQHPHESSYDYCVFLRIIHKCAFVA